MNPFRETPRPNPNGQVNVRVGGVSGGADLAVEVLDKLLERTKGIVYLAYRYSGGISIFCGDGAAVVWHFHHTEAFLPFPRASTTPDQGSGHQVAPASSGIGRGYFRSHFLYIDAYGFSSGSGMNPCSLSDLITPRIR